MYALILQTKNDTVQPYPVMPAVVLALHVAGFTVNGMLTQ